MRRLFRLRSFAPPTVVSLSFAAVLAVASPAPTAESGQALLPPRLRTYLDRFVKLDAKARERFLNGEPVTKRLDADPAHEVAVFGGIWVDAPIERYLAAVKDIEHFESGGSFRITKKISNPPRRTDFDELTVPDDDLTDLRQCLRQRCEVNLSSGALERLRREVRWDSPGVAEQVNEFTRQTALEFVNSYLEGGNTQLAKYRDADRPTFYAEEFAELVDRIPALAELLPSVRTYLVDFPRAPSLLNSESFIYWQVANVGSKPTIEINHMVIAEDPTGAIVVSKLLYASHYFWTALEMRVLARDQARRGGFWFVVENRSRGDGVNKFDSAGVGRRFYEEIEQGAIARLRQTKRLLEQR